MRTLAVALLIGAVAGATISIGIASAAEPRSVQQVRQATHFSHKGARALKAGNLNKASELYGRALDRLAGFPEAHLGLGHVAMAERRFDDALRHYLAARDGSRQLSILLYEERRRQFEHAANRLADLRQQRSQLVHRIERSRQGGRNRATPNYQSLLARLDQTVSRLESIDAPSPASAEEIPAEIHFFIGNALNRSGHFESAIAEWEWAAKRTRKFPPVHVNLAVAYWRMGRLRDAREQVRIARKHGAELNPDFIAELDAALDGMSVATADD